MFEVSFPGNALFNSEINDFLFVICDENNLTLVI